MKKIYSLFILLAFVLSTSNTFAQEQDWVKMMQDPNVKFSDVKKSFDAYNITQRAILEADPNSPRDVTGNVKVPGYKIFKRWEWYQEPRQGANGERVQPDATWKSMGEYNSKINPETMAGNWTYYGPPSLGSLPGVGRCNFVRIHPTIPTTYYTGSPAGGLWISTNSGVNWTTNTDQLNNVIGCTDIAIDPITPTIMYLATGDGDAGDNSSVGLLKSTNSGATWATTGLSFSMGAYRTISKVLIDPSNSNTILVATSAGIYKSTDAAATFTLQIAGSFKDMEYKPGITPGDTVYACGIQFYRSVNSGTSWTLITGAPLPTATGASRMAIAVTPIDRNRVYLIVGLPGPGYGTEGFYMSTNSGGTFTQPSTPNIGTQQWYDLCIAASPTVSGEVIIGGQTQFMRSTNSGTTWANNGGGTHVDYHDILFYAAGSYLIASDGGVYRTTNSGGAWTSLCNDLRISQMYGFGQSTSTANLNIQGWQDNGTSRYNGAWSNILGGDGMLCFIARTNNNYMWAEYYNGAMNRSTNGGASFTGCATPPGTAAWVCPWKEDPTTFNTIYTGFNELYRSTTGGTAWTALGTLGIGTSTVTQFAVSPANSNVIWVIAAGQLFRTTDGGGTWNTMTTLPAGSLSYVACHNTDVNRCWITYSGFNNNKKVYQTTNQGATWTSLSATLPNIPINCITYMNGSNNGLYIGTDVGVYYKDATMSVWQPFNTGLPNVIVTQIEIYYAGTKIRCSTYGRGLWESDYYTPGAYAPSANFTSNQTNSCAGAAVQFTDWSAGIPTSWNWSFPGGTPATSTAQNPLVTYNTPGVYSVTLIATNGSGTDTTIMANYINIASSTYTAPTTVNDSVCGPSGVVNLTAAPTSPGTLRWWNAPGGGSIVNTGPTYNPVIAATTTWYVDRSFPSGSPGTVGAPNNTMGAGAMFVANDIRGLYFDVLSPVILNTVSVYCNSDGNRTIEVYDANGNVAADTTIWVWADPTNLTVLTVNFTLYPGTNYFIKLTGLVDCYRNSAGAVYPYTSPSINITNSNAGTPGYYYFFYAWTYTNIVCNTSRTPVTGILQVCTDVNDIFAGGNFSVFPNPNNGTFDVNFNTANTSNFTVEITNVLGQTVFAEKLENFSGTYARKIDLMDQGKGVYMLTVTNGKQQAVKKVIVY